MITSLTMVGIGWIPVLSIAMALLSQPLVFGQDISIGESSTVFPSSGKTSATTIPSLTTSSPYTGTTDKDYKSSDSSEAADCSTPPTLREYCTAFLETETDGDSVFSIFGLNSTIDDIFNKVIQSDIIATLMATCKSGDWCLDVSFHERIYEHKEDFYAKPFCNDALLECLEAIAEYRDTCNDLERLFVLLEVLPLICGMEQLGDFQTECYTKTVEVVHVLYSDLRRDAAIDLDGPLCANYNRRIVKTFLCTRNACGQNQSVLLEGFEPLVNININSDMVFLECNLTAQCPDKTTLTPRSDFEVIANTRKTGPSAEDILEEELEKQNVIDKQLAQLETELEKEMDEELNGDSSVLDTNSNIRTFDTDLGLPPDKGLPTTNSDASKPENVPVDVDTSWDGDNTDDNVGGNGNDFDADNKEEENLSNLSFNSNQTVLFGAITLSTLALVGVIAAGLMSFRHYRKKQGDSYKHGYAQLTDEESRMLTYE